MRHRAARHRSAHGPHVPARCSAPAAPPQRAADGGDASSGAGAASLGRPLHHGRHMDEARRSQLHAFGGAPLARAPQWRRGGDGGGGGPACSEDEGARLEQQQQAMKALDGLLRRIDEQLRQRDRIEQERGAPMVGMRTQQRAAHRRVIGEALVGAAMANHACCPLRTSSTAADARAPRRRRTAPRTRVHICGPQVGVDNGVARRAALRRTLFECACAACAAEAAAGGTGGATARGSDGGADGDARAGAASLDGRARAACGQATLLSRRAHGGRARAAGARLSRRLAAARARGDGRAAALARLRTDARARA